MVIIRFKDKENWTTVHGQVISWKRDTEYIKDSRIQPTFVAPVVMTETVNGEVLDVQVTRWNAWYLEFWIKESEIHRLSMIQNCDEVTIADTDGVVHEVDTTGTESVIFEAPERVDETSGYVCRITYKTDRTVINKLSLDINHTGTSKYDLRLRYEENGDHIEDKHFKTDVEGVAVALEPEVISFTNDDGEIKTAKTITRRGTALTFFLTNSNAAYMMELSARAQLKTLNGIGVHEIVNMVATAMGNDLTKVELTTVDVVKVSYPELYKS